MKQVVEGHLKFQDSVYPEKQSFFERLAKGQSPKVLWITCADSRIEPTMITQSLPGDLFICRAVGNIVPTFGHEAEGVSSTIEYSVQQLKVSDIVVCGHSDCGAMKGLLAPESLETLPCTSRWLRHSEAARIFVKDNCSHLSPQEQLTAITEENVLAQLDNLRTHPAVSSRIKMGKLQLHGWVYNIASGGLAAFDPGTRTFRGLREVYQSDSDLAAAVGSIPTVERIAS